ncbi:MAG: NAD-dependent epimerase/dehydratase family protein [Bacteroidia bacterium]
MSRHWSRTTVDECRLLGRSSEDHRRPKLAQDLHLVVHLAGKAHSIPKTDKESREFYDVNLNGTINLFEGIKHNCSPKTRVIFVSTVAVYGLEEGENILENQASNPKTPYGLSKFQAEKWLTEFADNSNIKLTILRLPLVVGPKAKGNLGAMLSAIRKGRYFSIGDGTARKSMVLANDIADLISSDNLKSGIYNLTDGLHPSFRELEMAIVSHNDCRKIKKISKSMAKFIGLFGDVLGSRFPVNSQTIKKMTTSLTFDDIKARKEMNWSPRSVLSDSSWL